MNSEFSFPAAEMSGNDRFLCIFTRGKRVKIDEELPADICECYFTQSPKFIQTIHRDLLINLCFQLN